MAGQTNGLIRPRIAIGLCRHRTAFPAEPATGGIQVPPFGCAFAFARATRRETPHRSSPLRASLGPYRTAASRPAALYRRHRGLCDAGAIGGGIPRSRLARGAGAGDSGRHLCQDRVDTRRALARWDQFQRQDFARACGVAAERIRAWLRAPRAQPQQSLADVTG